MGKWLKVEIVCWGKQRLGSRSNLKKFNVPEIFMSFDGFGSRKRSVMGKELTK